MRSSAVTVVAAVAVALTAFAAASPAGGRGAPWCAGDCNGDSSVTIDELLIGINILLGAAELPACAALDHNGDRVVTVDEILTAIGAALAGCPELPRFPVSAYFWPDQAYGQTGSALGDLAAFGLNTVVAYYEYVKPDAPPFSGQPDCDGLVREAEVYASTSSSARRGAARCGHWTTRRWRRACRRRSAALERRRVIAVGCSTSRS